MGGSTCLVRSFSSPADTSCVAQEGSPIRVLGESISFGRFMSESLAWEKWSIFSHNRYVEEAEKFSKPGSVAEKKAYFEAHYKRKAAEKAASLIQEANAQANETFDSEAQEGNCTDSSIEITSKVDSNVTVNEQPDKDAVNYRVVDYVDTNKYKCDVEQGDLDISNVEGAEDAAHPRVDTNLNVDNSTLLDSANQFDNVEVHESIAVPIEKRMPDPGTAGDEASALPVKGREAHSSPTLSAKTRAAKLAFSLDERKAAAAVQPRSGINNGSKGNNSVEDSIEKRSTARDSVEKKRPNARSLHMSINLPSRTGETSKTAALNIQARKGINSTSNNMKCVGDLVQNRPTARSVHMSINLSSRTGEISKIPSVSEQNRIKKIRSNLPNISKDHRVASRASTTATNGLLNQASLNPRSQGRRTESLPNKSLSGGVSANAKLSSISVGCLKSSSNTKSNTRSLTISSPFRFRSEERAVKRKEFFERMDEIKSKGAFQVQLQRRPKEKSEHDHKKLRQSSGSKTKLDEDMNGGSQSPSNQMRNISLTQSQTPKLGRKASSSTVQEKSLANSWKPPISTNNNKRITGKMNRTRSQSVTSLSNTTRENASPNIQL